MPHPIKLGQPELEHGDDSLTLTVELDLATGPAPIFFRINQPGLELQNLAEAAVCTAMFFAMAEGRDIECELPVAAEFLANNRQLQPIFNRWHPELEKIDVHAPLRELPGTAPTPPWEPAEHGAAVLFSGGVDSFHTALEFQQGIQTGIYIHGFDTKLDDANYRRQISRHLQAAASDLGMRLIEIETNFRTHADPVIFWGTSHFALIAAVCHLTSETFERVYVPSSYAYNQLMPWGSHPLTDPLWGSGDLHFVHHGNAFTRPQKVATVATSEVARKHLRVCWENVDEAYNCGECEKCIRTMINLEICGRLDAFAHLFGKPLEVAALLPLVCIDTPSHLLFLNNNLTEAKNRGSDPEFIAELESVVIAATEFFDAKAIAKRSGKAGGDYFASAAWREHLLPKVRNQLFEQECEADPAWLADKLLRTVGRDRIFDLLWQHDHKWLRTQQKR